MIKNILFETNLNIWINFLKNDISNIICKYIYLKILNKFSLFTIRRSPRRAYKRAARFSLTKISHRSHRGARAHLVVRNQCPFIETRSIFRADENYFRSLCESLSARASKRKNLGSLNWTAINFLRPVAVWNYGRDPETCAQAGTPVLECQPSCHGLCVTRLQIFVRIIQQISGSSSSYDFTQKEETVSGVWRHSKSTCAHFANR